MAASDWVVWLVILAVLVLVAGVYLAAGRRGRDFLERRAMREALGARVREVMSRPVVVARQETTVEEAAAIMWSRRIGCLPVVGPDGRLIGIVTESDLTGIRPRLPDLVRGTRRIGERVGTEGVEQAYDEARAMAVGTVMTRAVVTAAEEERVSDVVVRMMDRDLHHLPVVEDGVPVGVVARHDLLTLLAGKSRGGSPRPSLGRGRQARMAELAGLADRVANT